MSQIYGRAIVLGGTGLVGEQLCRQLARDGDFGKSLAFVRAVPRGDQLVAGVAYHVVDFSSPQLEAQISSVLDSATIAGVASATGESAAPQALEIFCALGTTRAQAGGAEAFAAVDRDLVLRLLQIFRARGARGLSLVTAAGAHRESRFFYSQIKGEVEQSAVALGFARCAIFRPSLLMGEPGHSRKQTRAGEQAAQQLVRAMESGVGRLFGPQAWSKIWRGPLSAFQPNPASHVARAMLQVAREGLGGVFDARQIEERASVPA